MLERAIAVALAAHLSACATDTFDPTPPPDEVAPFGPVWVPAVPRPVEEGFELMQLQARAESPVVAVGPDHAMYVAAIDAATGWPRVGAAEGTRLPLPGRDGEATAVAIRATNDRRVHVVYSVDGEIRYTRMSADGAFEAPQTLASGDAREPNFVIGPAGEVVVGWTQFYARDDVGQPANPEVMLRIGAPAEDGVTFGAPESINPGCCGEGDEGGVHAMSGPSIAFGPDGIHVVYEWSTFGRTVIDYVRPVDGGYATPVVLSEAAFSPCPALVVDPDGVAHVTFIRELERDVFYTRVVDGVPSEPEIVFTPEDGRATLALLARDQTGALHLGVTVAGEGRRLVYVAPDGVATSIHEQSSGRVDLTPRAGGMLVAPDGKLMFAFRAVYEDDDSAHIAVGR